MTIHGRMQYRCLFEEWIWMYLALVFSRLFFGHLIKFGRSACSTSHRCVHQSSIFIKSQRPSTTLPVHILPNDAFCIIHCCYYDAKYSRLRDGYTWTLSSQRSAEYVPKRFSTGRQSSELPLLYYESLSPAHASFTDFKWKLTLVSSFQYCFP